MSIKFIFYINYNCVAAKRVVTVGSSAYSIWRSSYELHDRHKHQQSIGVDSPEARHYYSGIATNLLQVAVSSADVAKQKSIQDAKAIKGAFNLIKTANENNTDFLDRIIEKTETKKFQLVLRAFNCISTTHTLLNKLVNEGIILREVWRNFNK